MRREPMGEFNPAFYGPAVAALVDPLPLMALGRGKPNAAMRPRLQALDPANDFAAPVVNRDAAAACQAGLWLLHDFWEESHAIAQDLSTPEGSYWHAIEHRREPDPGNAKYWLRRVGEHPIHAALSSLAEDYTTEITPDDEWNGVAFVDICERHRGRGGIPEVELRQMQMEEWRLLFDHCYRLATGTG
jgi:hypothetical protein